MLTDLLLISGIDIPFPQAQINIHQPRVKEIAFIGEEAFFTGCEMLKFSKDALNIKDKSNLENKTNFEVLMSILKDKNPAAQKNKVSMLMVLTLMFPDYKIRIQSDCITFDKDKEEQHSLNSKNFDTFREIVTEMFCLRKDNNEGLNYNPGNDAAKKLAERFNKARTKVAEQKGETKKVSIISRYLSILAVGQKKDLNLLSEYTVYQLFDEFERFELKEAYNIYIKAKMAGAKDLDEVDNWMKDIH